MEYRQSTIDRMDKQTAKGIENYGSTINQSGPLKGGIERLDYLAEEYYFRRSAQMDTAFWLKKDR